MKSIFLILILEIAFTTILSELIHVEENPPQFNINTLQFVIDKYLKYQFNFLIIYTSCDSKVINDMSNYLHQKTPIPVYLFNDVISNKLLENITRSFSISHDSNVGYVLFSCEDVRLCISKFTNAMIESSNWNPRGYFLIILTKGFVENAHELNVFHKTLWKKQKVLHLAFIYWITKAENVNLNGLKVPNSQCYINTYNPFTQTVNVKSISKLINNNQNNLIIFPNNLLDINGYTLKISMTAHPPLTFESDNSRGEIYFRGPEVDMISTIAHKFNATTNIFHPIDNIYGMTFPNKVNGKSEDDLKHGMPDVNGNWDILKIDNEELSTYPHYWQSITALVPKASRIPRYKSYSLPFSSETWMIYCITSLVLALTCTLFKWMDVLRKSDSKYKDYNPLLETFRMILVGNTILNPKLLSHRLYAINCILYCIITINTFQGSLTSILTVPKYYKDIDSIKQLDDSGIKISLLLWPEATDILLSKIDMEDQLTTRLIKKIIFILDDEEALDMVAIHRNICRLTVHYVGIYYLKHHRYHKDGKPLLHLMEESYYSIPVTYTLSKDSPYLARFNNLTTRIHEVGLLMKWLEDTIAQTSHTTNSVQSSSTLMALSMEHLQTAFYILVSALCTSLLVFFIEVIGVF